MLILNNWVPVFQRVEKRRKLKLKLTVLKERNWLEWPWKN